MPPKYNFEKIKFATDPGTFEKAVKLYEDGKVVGFKEDFGDYSAVVLGTWWQWLFTRVWMAKK